MSIQSWKNSEKQWAKELNRFKIDEAYRKSRAGNFAVSDFDVGIPSADWIKSDSKYSKNSFKTNRLLNETEFKYCKAPGDTAVLITKGYREVGQCATVDSSFLAMLIAFWMDKAPREELWSIYLKEKPKGKEDGS